jgi:hypothetical protein
VASTWISVVAAMTSGVEALSSPHKIRVKTWQVAS